VIVATGFGHRFPRIAVGPEDAHMAMTEAFATTAAQTIPVLALAGVVEFNALLPPRTPATSTSALIDLLSGIGYLVVVILWFLMIGLLFSAEWTCLDYLSDTSRNWAGDRGVKIAILGSLALLALAPAWIGLFRGMARLDRVGESPPSAAQKKRLWHRR
jgi:hypothetical protein